MGSAVIFFIEFEPSIVKFNIVFLEVWEETDQVKENSNSWDKPSNDLPPSRVSLIWFVQIILEDTDKHESEDTWTDVLDAQTPVQSEYWFPPKFDQRINSTNLRAWICDLSDTAHTDFLVPLSNVKAWDFPWADHYKDEGNDEGNETPLLWVKHSCDDDDNQ